MVKVTKVDKETPEPKKFFQPKQIFVSGIPYSANEEQLREFFAAQVHAITEIKMPKY
jgi:RNA recognition motif-containing protein